MKIIERHVVMLVSLSDGSVVGRCVPAICSDDCTDEEIKAFVRPALLAYMHSLIVDGFPVVVGSVLCPFERVGVGWCGYRTVLELLPLFDSSIDDMDDCHLY